MLANTRVAWFNGRILPEGEIVIPFRDRSWKSGDGAFDMTRTFNGAPFRLKEHIERFYRSLRYVRIDPGLSPAELIAVTEDVVARNEHLRAPHGDWWVTQRISRGVDAVGDEGWEHSGPNLVVDVSPLPLAARAAMFRDGAEVMTTTMRRTAPAMLSPRAKLNNYLNMIVAGQSVPDGVWPLLLDEHGNLAEGQGSNIFIVQDGALRTPRERYVLPGVSRQMTIDLAGRLGIACTEDDIDLFDAANAEEMFLTSTSLCILPVRRFNGQLVGGQLVGGQLVGGQLVGGQLVGGRPAGDGAAGPVTRRLIDAYAAAVGCDFVAQYLARLPPGRSDGA
jgi:branched-chain amino acid aminotransferase